MGYAMSRPQYYYDVYDQKQHDPGSSSGQCCDEKFDVGHDVFQLTKLRSEPSNLLRRSVNAKQNFPVPILKMLAGREANYSGRGRFTPADCSHALRRYLPANGPWPVDRMDSRVYVSQFSADGRLFVAGFQKSYVRIYNVEKGWKVQKDIIARNFRWTITDTSLSPDQRHLVYSSMSHIVHIVDVGTASTESLANINEIHDGLDFDSRSDGLYYSFGIFSVKFSADGRELVAGSNDESIYVYDLVGNKLTLRIPAHESDVNTVTFADETGHLIYSGSDDNLCKVWDRRALNVQGKPAGVLTGHLEGITFIDSRGDGRHFISNGKDQVVKLWDIRKMTSNPKCSSPRISDWDYRSMEYPSNAKHLRHPNDLSLATYRGHSVLRTLIRCYFSPALSTGQRYIYTGSNDGGVHIYDMVTGDQVSKLDYHHSTVRDCSWHPHYPMLVSSSWDGTISRWEFPGNGAPPAMRIRRRPPPAEATILRHIFL